MRKAFLIPFAFAAAVAGCGGEVSTTSEREETASRAAASLERDLTLSVPRVPATEVASAVELGVSKPEPAATRRHRPKPMPAPAPAPAAEPEPEAAAEPESDPVSTPTVGEAIADAVVDNAASGGRELAPGRTVTIIPVSSGPSVAVDEGDSWLPSGSSRGVLVGGGGTCRRRGGGGGIGIAARFRVGIPAFPVR